MNAKESAAAQRARWIAEAREARSRSGNNSATRPTGIPPHVSILRELSSIRADISSVQAEVASVRSDVASLRDCVGEDGTIVQAIVRAIRDEVMSISARSDVVAEERFAVAMVDRLIERGVIAPPVPTSAAASAEESSPHQTLTEELPAETPRLFTWGGGFHFVPEDFKLPSISTEAMWYRWCCGDPSALLADGEIIKIPPFRMLRPEDFNIPNQRKRFSDLKKLMGLIENEACSRGQPAKPNTPASAFRVYKACKSAIELPGRTMRDRARRKGQMTWLSHAITLGRSRTRGRRSASLSQ